MHTSRRCCFVLFAVGALALGSGLQAQYSGTYTINAKGSGSRNFKSFNEATAALAKHGVTGPVEMIIIGGHSGTDSGKTTYVPNRIFPIPGTSRRNRVTFRGGELGAGFRKGGIGDGPALQSWGTSKATPRWVTFRGVRFFPGYVEVGGDHLEFAYSTIPGLRLWGSDLHVHHCSISTNYPFRTYALQLYGDRARVHHNEVRGRPIASVVWVAGQHAVISNNLLHMNGGSGVHCGKNGLIAHNTIGGTTFEERFTVNAGSGSEVVGNIVVNTGRFVVYAADVRSRYNIFAYPSESPRDKVFAQVGSQKYASLTALQKAGYDAGSIVGDPKFVDWDKEYGWVEDAHLEFDSPAINALRKRIRGVRVDLDGLSRDGKPDIGCYEFRVTSNFGTGCPGTKGRVPKLGFHGRAVVGSKNFAITLSNALGRARALLVFGASKEKWGSVELPYNLGGTCKMLVAPDAMHLVMVSGRGGGKGHAIVKVVLPTDPKLKGRRVYGQWAVEDGASAIGLALSNGGALVVR